MPVPRLMQDDFIDPIMQAHYAVHTTFESLASSAHCHDFYEVFLVRRGTVLHVVNEQENTLPTGTLVFIRPDDAHYYRRTNITDVEVVNLAFPRAVIDDLLVYLGDGFDDQRLLKAPVPPLVQLSATELLRTAAQLDDIARIPYTHKSAVRVVLRSLLAEWLTRHFLLAQLMAAAPDQPAWFTQLCQHMQQPAHFSRGVVHMQHLAHKSPEHLSRSFRRYLGLTPTMYVNHLRLHYAANLLIYTDRTVLDIAAASGFENLSTFYRGFKKQFGIAPAQFRRQEQAASLQVWPLT